MTWLIGISGPLRIGKSWFCQQALPLFKDRVRILSVSDFIWEEVQFRVKWDGTYEEFKWHTFDDGITGRDILIEHAEMRRRKDPYYWQKLLCSSPKFLESDVVFCESVANPVEQDGFLIAAKKFITIVIAPSQYSIGALYDDHYRVCLSPLNGFRVVNSGLALESLKQKLEDAKAGRIQGTIWNVIHLEGLVV